MSAIPPMDAASRNPAPQASGTTGPGVVEPGHPFAEVMRSVVAPAPMKQTVSNTSGATSSARLYPNRPTGGFRTHINRRDESASMSSTKAPNGNPATRASNQDGQNTDSSPDMSTSSRTADGLDSSLMEGQIPPSVAAAVAGDRSSQVAPQRVSPAETQTGSSPSGTGRKQTSPAKEANVSGGVAGSSAIATATTIRMASVSAMATPIPVVKLPAGAQAGSSAATLSTRGTNPLDAHTTAKDSSLSSPATASGLAARISQADGSAAAAGIVPDGAGISTDGIVDSQHSAMAHGAPTNNETSGASSNLATASNATATPAASQNDGSVQGSSGSQPASAADGTSAHALPNGISNSAADANTSNAVSVDGAGNAGAAGNDPVRSGGDRASMSIHGSDGSKSSSFTAAIPTGATAAKNFADPHANLADSSLGLHDSASLVLGGGHPGASGSFSSPAARSTVARGITSDAFTAIDSVATGERGVLLHAAPHQVAVGISDPSLGWVEVRAERISGQIAAALTTNSTASHAALTSVLPTMATYLQDHQAGVHQVHVETSLAGGQAGTGSNGQSSSQGEARTVPDNRNAASTATNSWNAVPLASATVAAGQRNNFINEGHHFSIRA